MIIANHRGYNKNKEEIKAEQEVLDETIYDATTKKKNKLITELRTEKVLNPSVTKIADEAIEEIKKKKQGSKTVGNVSYYYSFAKGMYFYIHKIINREGNYTNTIHFYIASHNDSELFNEIQKDDILL